MSDAKLEMKIPAQLIENTILTELVKQMPNKEQFTEQLVLQMMRHKANSYDRETVFQAACREMVLTEARKIFGEWLDQHREMIRKSLTKYLTKNKSEMVHQIAKNMADGIASYSASVVLKVQASDG